MKMVLTVALLSVLLAGCIYYNNTSPGTPSKLQTGAVLIQAYTMEGGKPEKVNAEICLDGKLICITDFFVLDKAELGNRVVRVTAPGYKPYEKTITILGDIRQQLNVCLEKQ